MKNCPFCNHGKIEISINGASENTSCPKCDGTGIRIPTQFDIAMSGIMALPEAYNDDRTTR